MKKIIFTLNFFLLLNISIFSQSRKIDNELMFTNNWYTANTIDEIGTIEIIIPNNWNISDSVIYDENDEKIAEGAGYFLYKISRGQRYNGVIRENIPPFIDYEPSDLIATKEGNTKQGR